MRTYLLFFLIFCSSLVWPNSNKEQTIDVKHISINLNFDWKKKQAYGTAEITLSPLTATNKIRLDVEGLYVNFITSGEYTYYFNYDGMEGMDGFIIKLERVYQPNEILTLKLDYRTDYINHSDPNNIWGSYGKGLRFFEPTSSTPNKNKQIWSSGEPDNNKYWFPCNEDISDLRTTEFTATVEKPLMVISNGELVKVIENSDNTRTFYFKADNPYPNYLTSFVVGNYHEIITPKKEFNLSTFCYPHEQAAAEASIERLPDMANYFSNLLGVPYPFKKYSQVVVQDYPFPGLDGQHTMSLISDNFIDDYRTHKDFLYLWDGVESQALASQWFGNLILPKSWKDIWLNKGFCHYLDGLYNDYKNGHDEFLIYYLNNDSNTTISDFNSGYKHPIVTDTYNNLQEFTSDNYAKIRSSLVLRMLRKQVGEEKWWKIIKKYTQTYAGKQVSTDDFKNVVQEVCDENLDWFFDQWFYKMGHPIFEVHKIYNPVKKVLTITAKQTQIPEKKDEVQLNGYFQGKIEIEINDKIETVQIDAKELNIFEFNLAEEPKLVNFDFEKTWIKEVKFEKSFKELIYQSKKDKDVLGKWAAIQELVKIANDTTTSTESKKIIHKTFREIILSDSYWRLRGNTLFQLRSILKTPYDKETIEMLKKVIKTDKPWVKTGAITFLGMTNDSQYANIYINALNDNSDRVINAAAIALGKTKSPKAYDTLIKLADKPSWKSQSLISSLNGLKELKDPRGADFALKAIGDTTLPRWWLATPIWDYPIAAAETLVALGKADVAYPIILDRFKKSMIDNDYNDIFSNVLLVATLADKRGKEVFDLLKEKFKTDENAMIAIQQYENQFNEAIKSK